MCRPLPQLQLHLTRRSAAHPRTVLRHRHLQLLKRMILTGRLVRVSSLETTVQDWRVIALETRVVHVRLSFSRFLWNADRLSRVRSRASMIPARN